MFRLCDDFTSFCSVERQTIAPPEIRMFWPPLLECIEAHHPGLPILQPCKVEKEACGHLLFKTKESSRESLAGSLKILRVGGQVRHVPVFNTTRWRLAQIKRNSKKIVWRVALLTEK